MSGNKRRTVDRLCRDGGLAWMCATVFGCFQPDTLREFLGQARDIGNGLVPRFHIFVWPDYQKVKSVDRPVNELASSAFKHLVKTLAEMPTESVELHFSPEAQELWYKLHDENEEKQRAETNPGKRSHLAKYGGALPKIAALYQLIDYVASGQGTVTKRVANLETGKVVVTENLDAVPEGRLIIATEYLERAASFLRYLESHMHRVYDSKLNQAQLAASIIGRSIKNGTLLSDPVRGGLLARDVVRARLCDDTRIATNGLEELENKRWVQGIPFKPAVGRPTTVWAVNPKVFLLP
jgi:hypothetical protein